MFRRRLVSIVLILVFGLVVVTMPTGLYVLKPGPAKDLAAMVTVTGGPTAAEGRLVMVTIRADRATPLAIMIAAFEPGWDLVPRRSLIPPGQSEEDYMRNASRQMTESQQVAELVAAGYLQRRLPPVGFDVGEIGGPSAGIMFALEIVRQAEGTPPAGGVIVAGSGMLLPDGRVAAVGGVRQKAIAARRAGAKLFIVPRSEADLALSAAGGMRVVAVDDFAQAARELFGPESP